MTCWGLVRRNPSTLSPPDVIARIVSPDCGCSAARSQSGSSHDCSNINRPPYGMGRESLSDVREVGIIALRRVAGDGVAAAGAAVQRRTIRGPWESGEFAQERVESVEIQLHNTPPCDGGIP